MHHTGCTVFSIINILLHFTGRLDKASIGQGKIFSTLCKLIESCFEQNIFMVMKSGVWVCDCGKRGLLEYY